VSQPNDKKPAAESFLWMYGLLAALGIIGALIGVHILHAAPQSQNIVVTMADGGFFLPASLLLLVALLATFPLALIIELKSRSDLKQQQTLLDNFNDQMQQLALLVNLSAENQLISDRAKAVAFREKDRDAVRRAVSDEVARGDWEAALALVNDMETVFGYRSEAEQYRQDIAAQRQDVVQKQISEQMTSIDRYTNAQAWPQALQEAQRVMALFPNDEKVRHLPQEIESRRQACKKKLIDQWNEAVARHDVDESIEILKHLDTYLTAPEAESMQATARGVFKEKIGLLRTQFTMAVQDRRWAEALRLGDSIMTEFPNSRMAQEVRDMMEMLRQRAADGNVAKV